jgi:hypothetical protein
MLNVLFYLRGFEMYSSFKELVITCQLMLEDQPRDTAFSLKLRVPRSIGGLLQVKHQQMGNGWIPSTTMLIL